MDATCCCPASDGGTAVIALVVATATAVVTGLQVLYGRKAAVSASSDHWASHLTKFLVDEILSCDRQRELFKQLARGGRTAEDDRRILTNLNESREDSLRRIHTLEVLWPDTA